MAKAANGARLLFSSFALSLAVASSPACPTSEDALGECGATPTSAVLLQVDRGERLLTHADEEHDRSSKPNKQWTLVSDDNEEPVTMKDLMRRTEPLQDQIDDVQSDVKELRSDLRRQSGGSDRKKDDEDEGSTEDDEGDERSSEGNEEGGERSSEGNEDKNGMNDLDKDYIRNNDDKALFDHYSSSTGRSSNFHIHKPASNEDREASKDWAWPESGNEEEASESDKPKRDQPDWGGIAPPPPWNGLEDVNAKDSGPDASWKGDGVGVASGKKYLGTHPYEKLMDVDYVIDSNPEPTRRRTKPEPTRRRPSIPKGDGNRRRTPAKSSPKNGEKSSPSKPKAPSRSEGKSPSKKAPSSEPKTAPKSERKTAPKSSQEKRKSKASGKKSPASGKESAPTEGE